jgi:hypothetical protein
MQVLCGMVSSVVKRYVPPSTPMDPIAWLVTVTCKNMSVFGLLFTEDDVAVRCMQIIEQNNFPGMSTLKIPFVFACLLCV